MMLVASTSPSGFFVPCTVMNSPTFSAEEVVDPDMVAKVVEAE